MNERDVTFGIDVETGGFEPGRHALLAIGLWWGTGAGSVIELRILVRRQLGTIVEPEARAKNGWETDEQWADRGAVPLAAAVYLMLDYVSTLQKRTGARRLVPVAHNDFMERSFLWHAMLHCGGGSHPLERWHEHVSKHWRCTMGLLLHAMDAGLIPEGSAGLDRLMALSGQLPRGPVHDPCQDAKAAVNGRLWLLNRVREGLGGVVEERMRGLAERCGIREAGGGMEAAARIPDPGSGKGQPAPLVAVPHPACPKDWE